MQDCESYLWGLEGAVNSWHSITKLAVERLMCDNNEVKKENCQTKDMSSTSQMSWSPLMIV